MGDFSKERGLKRALQGQNCVGGRGQALPGVSVCLMTWVQDHRKYICGTATRLCVLKMVFMKVAGGGPNLGFKVNWGRLSMTLSAFPELS